MHCKLQTGNISLQTTQKANVCADFRSGVSEFNLQAVDHLLSRHWDDSKRPCPDSDTALKSSSSGGDGDLSSSETIADFPPTHRHKHGYSSHKHTWGLVSVTTEAVALCLKKISSTHQVWRSSVSFLHSTGFTTS